MIVQYYFQCSLLVICVFRLWRCIFKRLGGSRSIVDRVLCVASCIKADSHMACRAHAVPLPCRAAKGLECVFSI
jgi:hypothetical protein